MGLWCDLSELWAAYPCCCLVYARYIRLSDTNFVDLRLESVIKHALMLMIAELGWIISLPYSKATEVCLNVNGSLRIQ